MNIIGWEKDSLVNGDGIRLVIWVAGCERHCKGCQNKEAQNRHAGHEFTVSDLVEIMQILKENDYYSGITWLGGSPLESYNVKDVTSVSKILKEQFPKLTQWLYTGKKWEEVKDLPIMRYIDVLVDGEFREELADVSYPYAGSRNQRVLDVKRSLEMNVPVPIPLMDEWEKEKYGRRCDCDK